MIGENVTGKKTITVKFGRSEKEYDIIQDPVPHILVPSKKKIHGWEFYSYPDKHHRECSQERALINAYNGCWQNGCVGCSFCYTRSMWGYFRYFWNARVATVFKDFDQVVKNQISKLHTCPTLYLSPVTDPFMDLESEYHINKKIIEDALEVNLPSEFITKMGNNLTTWDGYGDMISAMANHPHCFGQFTVYARDEVRKSISPGASSVEEQFKAIKFCHDKGLFTVCRLDPFIPYLSDSEDDFEFIVAKAKKAGADHLISSCIDVPRKVQDVLFPMFSKLSMKHGEKKTVEEYKQLYQEPIKNDLNATSDYRRNKFQLLQDICNKHGISMSLCMEFWVDDAGIYHGFNDEYMTSNACEGMVIPMYVRNDLDDGFSPLKGCDGNCLNHAKGCGDCDGICNYEPFTTAKGNSYQDYKKFRIPRAKDGMDRWLND